MQCFLDYIGIKGFGSEPESGLYINQLPGITLESLQKIRENEQGAVGEIWADVQARALRRFRKDYLRAFHIKWVGFCCTTEDCDPEVIACNHKELFEDAWLYLLGNELMLERLYSSRLNRYTTIDKDGAAELKDYYQVEYEKALSYGITMLPKGVIEACYECNSSITQVESLP